MVSNDIIEKDSGLWKVMGHIGQLYASYHNEILVSIDMYGRWITLDGPTGNRNVKWDEIHKYMTKSRGIISDMQNYR